jgi:hypothetical protein
LHETIVITRQLIRVYNLNEKKIFLLWLARQHKLQHKQVSFIV